MTSTVPSLSERYLLTQSGKLLTQSGKLLIEKIYKDFPNPSDRPDIDQVEELIEQYRRVKTINNGTFAEVYLVEKNKQLYAMKVVEKRETSVTRDEPLSPRSNIEARIQLKIDLETVVKCYDFREDATRQVFLMEYVPKELFTELRIREVPFRKKEIVKIYRELIKTLKFCYENYGIIHRDIKSENILLTSDNHIKLGDFGFATANKTSKRWAGTSEYLPPEIIKQSSYDYKVDVWACGILLYEMFYLTTPFGELTHPLNNTEQDHLERIELYSRIIRLDYSFPSSSVTKISDSAKDLIQQQLKRKPEERLTYEQILDHPFLRHRRRKRKPTTD